jgi:hypothetical protein
MHPDGSMPRRAVESEGGGDPHDEGAYQNPGQPLSCGQAQRIGEVGGAEEGHFQHGSQGDEQPEARDHPPLAEQSTPGRDDGFYRVIDYLFCRHFDAPSGEGRLI